MTDTLKLGQPIEGTQHRDAIHIAVAPVVATTTLYPGQDIGFVEKGDTQKVGKSAHPIGIVDPFLKQPVYAGMRLWMFLYPYTITSLRHDWTHPAFTAAAAPHPDRAESERWLRNYAVRVNTYDDPDRAYQRLIDGLRAGAMLSHGTTIYSVDDIDDAEELRRHAEIVLGRPIDAWENFTFSCSC